MYIFGVPCKKVPSAACVVSCCVDRASFFQSSSSASVGFWPSARMTVPMSLIPTVPAIGGVSTQLTHRATAWQR